jgi:hypothetical protein
MQPAHVRRAPLRSPLLLREGQGEGARRCKRLPFAVPSRRHPERVFEKSGEMPVARASCPCRVPTNTMNGATADTQNRLLKHPLTTTVLVLPGPLFDPRQSSSQSAFIRGPSSHAFRKRLSTAVLGRAITCAAISFPHPSIPPTQRVNPTRPTNPCVPPAPTHTPAPIHLSRPPTYSLSIPHPRV